VARFLSLQVKNTTMQRGSLLPAAPVAAILVSLFGAPSALADEPPSAQPVAKIDMTANSEEVFRSGIFMRRRVLGRGFVDDKILFWRAF